METFVLDINHVPAELPTIPGITLRRLDEHTLEASAVADPHITVKADVERLLTSPLLSPKVSVSGHVYDIATGRVTTVLDARHPQPAGTN